MSTVVKLCVHKCREMYWPAKRLSAFHEGKCYSVYGLALYARVFPSAT
jgi:hypothetical protein